jgi:hypothetical protein
MAVTKIWAVHSRLDHLINYVGNTEKTANPDYGDLAAVLEYAGDDVKTEQKYFVSGVNCQPETAYHSMRESLAKNEKPIRVLAYHGYQSFAEGEVSAEAAHEIGVKLAQELWGDKFQVLVATHLNTGKFHNHFVLCSTSYIDGRRFNCCKDSYRRMRQASDRLCHEYELSVVKQPRRGRTKNNGEVQAEREGRPTWRGIIKAEVDEAISQSMTEDHFVMNLKRRGYEVKLGKDISVRPPGKERFFRLERNFGAAYSRQGIMRQMRAQGRPKFPEPERKRRVVKVKCRGNLKTAPKITGFRALYFHYLYLMGKLPARNQTGAVRQRPANKVPFVYREDLLKIDKISKEVTLLFRHRIDTAEQLSMYKEGRVSELAGLVEQRQGLRNKMRRMKNGLAIADTKGQIALLSARIGEVRKEVGLCDDIATRSVSMKEKMQKMAQEQNKNIYRREKKRNEPFR